MYRYEENHSQTFVFNELFYASNRWNRTLFFMLRRKSELKFYGQVDEEEGERSSFFFPTLGFKVRLRAAESKSDVSGMLGEAIDRNSSRPSGVNFSAFVCAQKE